MNRVTVSTKVAPDVVKKITDLGFCISDSLQVGIELFLKIPDEEKWSLVLRQRYLKKALRAQAKLKGHPGSTDSSAEGEGKQ